MSYKSRIAASKARIDSELREQAKKFKGDSLAFVREMRRAKNIPVNPEYAAELLRVWRAETLEIVGGEIHGYQLRDAQGRYWANCFVCVEDAAKAAAGAGYLSKLRG